MNSQRLQNVAKAIREGDPEDFRMNIYMNNCGTPACALGHYAARTDLQNVFGLSRISDRSLGPVGTVICLDGSYTIMQTPFTVAAEHFDITITETIELFAGDGCGKNDNELITAKQAITYIEDFIARHETVEVIEDLIQSTKEEQHEFVQR